MELLLDVQVSIEKTTSLNAMKRHDGRKRRVNMPERERTKSNKVRAIEVLQSTQTGTAGIARRSRSHLRNTNAKQLHAGTSWRRLMGVEWHHDAGIKAAETRMASSPTCNAHAHQDEGDRGAPA